jgi:hypothetical protein
MQVASAAPVAPSTADAAPASPAFRSLFQDGGGRAQPVSQTVRELWGNSASLTADPPASSTATSSATVAALPVKASSGGGLDLFSDRSGTFSG